MATYAPIQSVALTTTTSSVTFSGIDQNYTNLIIVANSRGSEAGGNLELQFNSDTSGSGTNYSRTYLYDGGSSAGTSGRSSNNSSIIIGTSDSAQFITTISYVMNYSNSTTLKTVLSRTNDTAGLYPAVGLRLGLWRGTPAPISSIRIYPQGGTLSAGSTFSLYGIKSGAPQALGGDLIATDGNFWYHTFRSTQTFIPQRPLTVEYLVIAGGGGGGYGYGGGGGAGGYRNSVNGETTGGGGSNEPALALSPIAYTVTVGAGGAGKDLSAGYGTNGSNSVLGSITSTGGGGGGYISGGTGLAGLTGGSGGGGGGDAIDTARTNGGARVTSPIQGFAGSGAWYNGGGGGGAGATPTMVQSLTGGGNGLSSSITGSAVTRGGGGAGNAGTGGSGGGGNGGSNGTANTGGGGGGTAGNGASGIVIVRYPV
jgi:hypothetical protein